MNEKLKNIAQFADIGKYFEVLEVIKEKDDKYCIIVESYDGISLNDCIKISQFISKNLTESENFEITVSSPGLDRPLKYPIQIKRHKGKKAEIIDKNDEKFRGTIIDYENGKILFEVINKKKLSEIKEFDFNEIKTVKLIL